MNQWIEERVHRLMLSVDRCQKAAGLLQASEGQPAELLFLRKESSICLRRALALWWGLRWGRR